MEIKNVDVVLLCGGLGTRLKSVMGEKPKVMADFEGRPFMDLQLQYLCQQGFKRAILCTGIQSSVIEQYYRNIDLGIKVLCSMEKEPLGTGGALKYACPNIKSELFFVLNGDVFCAIPYQDFLDYHISFNDAVATLAVKKIKKNQDYGGIELGEDNRIHAFHEKEKSKDACYVNVGSYCFHQKAITFMPEEDKFSMEYDFFPRLVGQGFYGFHTEEDFLDIGTPERLAIARQALKLEGNS